MPPRPWRGPKRVPGVVFDRLANGRATLEEGAYDVVLLVLILPDRTGLESLSRLCPGIPAAAVIVFTGLNEEAVAMEALRKGTRDYLAKASIQMCYR